MYIYIYGFHVKFGGNVGSSPRHGVMFRLISAHKELPYTYLGVYYPGFALT